jgi:hypothetical protein
VLKASGEDRSCSDQSVDPPILLPKISNLCGFSLDDSTCLASKRLRKITAHQEEGEKP